MIGDFHFLRPWWLVLFVPLGLLVFAMRRRNDPSRMWRGVIASHLLPFLLQGEERHAGVSPLWLIASGWFVGVIAIAGPTWHREPAPFTEDTATLAIVMKVSPSMLTEDVQPNRLARATQKIHDLLAQRKGAKTALIAYAGTAHRVMPATTDGGIIDTFAQALDPKIMPTDGDSAAEALIVADRALAGGGSILWVTDSIAPEQGIPLAAWRKKSRTPVRILPPLLPGTEWDGVERASRGVDAMIVRMTADDSDVSQVARVAKFAPVTDTGTSDRWHESGYWLTPLLAALLLPFFRKGWMNPTAAQG